MTSLAYRLTALSFLPLALGAAACGSSGNSTADMAPGSQASPQPQPASSPERAIAEADIIQLAGGRLYAMSKAGSVSIIDVSTPGRLLLLGQTRLGGVPFEMYLRGDTLLAMTNGATRSDGTAVPLSTDGTVPLSDPNAGSAIVALDISVPAKIKQVATFQVPGEIADSRVVGNVLYLATYENAACYGCGQKPRTLVTSFDVTDTTTMKQVDQASFQSNAPDSYNLPWGMNWKRSIFVTDQRLYIGGHADIDPSTYNYGSTNGQSPQREGIVDVLDITDPQGHLGKGARITLPGAVLSRWQMDEQNGVLRVISEPGAGRTGNGTGMPEVDTFTIVSTQSFVPLGRTTLTLPMQEGLRTVRFDTDRAYAITYNQTDPLFTIDLSNPATPVVRGQLKMPGFMFYLEPHGDRVIGLGIDRTDPKGSLNVSLFDVSNLDAPKMLSRAAFGGASFSEDYEILNGELPEDQDRIQKAFRVFSDGTVVVPFSSPLGCNDGSSGIQLVNWSSDSLTNRALLPIPGNPRRAFENNSDMIAVSDSNVRSFSLKSLAESDDMIIGTCTQSSTYAPYQGPYYGYGGNDYQGGWGRGCSIGAAPIGKTTGITTLGVLALAGALAGLRRRRA